MRVHTLGFILALAAVVACGSSKKDEPQVLDLAARFPASNEVAGWTRDAVNPVQVGVGRAGATALVDGAADPFVADGLVQLGMAGYLKTGETLNPVRIWHMSSAAAAQAVYGHLLSNSLYAANTWDPCPTAVGEACRFADTGNNYWFNTRKGAFHVEATINKTATSSADALAFLAALLAKLP